MTRTGLSADLSRHTPEPFVELHPEDAAAWGVTEGALTRVETGHGQAVVKARLSDRQRRGCAFMPMHWTDAFAPQGRANPLVGGAVDPTSGQPEFKHTPVRVRPYRETWKGFFIARRAYDAPAGADLIWRRTTVEGGQLHEFAGRGDVEERNSLRRVLIKGAEGERLSIEDAAVGLIREAWLTDGRLDRVLFVTTAGRLPARDWLVGLFEQDALDADARQTLLVGRPAIPVADAGPMVCACLKVTAGRITAAIGAGVVSVDAVGAATGAGTNCGSCRIEIARMLTAAAPSKTLETRHAA